MYKKISPTGFVREPSNIDKGQAHTIDVENTACGYFGQNVGNCCPNNVSQL